MKTLGLFFSRTPNTNPNPRSRTLTAPERRAAEEDKRCRPRATEEQEMKPLMRRRSQRRLKRGEGHYWRCPPPTTSALSASGISMFRAALLVVTGTAEVVFCSTGTFSSALQPCKCPMCSQRINKLMPEASLYSRSEVEISRVIKNVGDYNCLFVGGISGLVLKFLAIPLYIKRMFREMLNADRPGLYLHEMRLVALLLGILYSFIPFDFLRIGRRNIIDVFDYSAFALSFILYAVGLYVRRRRLRNVRELVEVQARHDD